MLSLFEKVAECSWDRTSLEKTSHRRPYICSAPAPVYSHFLAADSMCLAVSLSSCHNWPTRTVCILSHCKTFPCHVFMYVSLCMFMDVCVYVHIYVYVHTYMYIYMHTYVHTHIPYFSQYFLPFPGSSYMKRVVVVTPWPTGYQVSLATFRAVGTAWQWGEWHEQGQRQTVCRQWPRSCLPQTKSLRLRSGEGEISQEFWRTKWLSEGSISTWQWQFCIIMSFILTLSEIHIMHLDRTYSLWLLLPSLVYFSLLLTPL